MIPERLVNMILLGGLVDDEHWSARPLRMGLLLLAPLAMAVQTASQACVRQRYTFSNASGRRLRRCCSQ